jgi:hypothetical protein
MKLIDYLETTATSNIVDNFVDIKFPNDFKFDVFIKKGSLIDRKIEVSPNDTIQDLSKKIYEVTKLTIAIHEGGYKIKDKKLYEIFKQDEIEFQIDDNLIYLIQKNNRNNFLGKIFKVFNPK